MNPIPQSKKALVLLVEDQIGLVSKKTIEDLGYRCAVAQNKGEAETFLRVNSPDLLLCRIHEKGEDFRLFDLAQEIHPECRCIAVIDALLEDYFPQLATRAYPRNLIADNQPFDLQELIATIQKLLSGDIFGIEKYQVDVQQKIRLTRSDQKYDVIEQVRKFFLQNQVQERLVRNVELILNELLMNAIFDAPTDDRGEKLYFQVDRGAGFELKPREQPEVQYGISEERLAISVSDQFGDFREDTFFSYLNRCFSERSILEGAGQGAGMGLFLVFKSLNQLVINVAAQKKTEVMALLDYRSSFRDLKTRRHSFHFFHLD